MKQFIYFILFLSSSALVGCGGGGGGSDTDSNAQSNNVGNNTAQGQSTNETAPSSSSNSTGAISLENSYTTYQFDQYKLVYININLEDFYAQLPGNIIVVRVFDDYGNTYLSTANTATSQLSEVFSVALTVNTLFIELYDDQQSLPITQEIKL